MAVGTANGVKLYYETASAGTWQEVPCMVDFNGWTPTAAEVDVSCLSSTNYRDFVPGLKDAGTGEHTVRLDLEDQDQYQDVFAFINANPVTIRRWALTFPASLVGVASPPVPDVLYATAFPQSLPLSGGTDAPADFGLTLRFSGAYTWAAALPAS